MPRLQQMRFSIATTVLALLFLSGCQLARNSTLSPKPEAGTIQVTIKVPEELVARDMQVIYRSTKCTTTYRSMLDWEKRTRDNYAGLHLQPVRRPGTDLYEATLAVNGSGACRWRLSNAIFGVSYRDPSKFGSDVKLGAGGGLIVMFDESDSAHGGPNFKASISAEGVASVKQNYYPWLHERFLGGDRKSISLTTDADIFIRLRAPNARAVHFEPIFHPQFLVRSIGPKVKRKGESTVFFYPDGSHSTESRTKPSFKKLEAMRQAAEARL